MTEDEVAGWHHRLDGPKFEWTLGVGDGQGGLACCDSRGCKGSDMTEWLNWTEHLLFLITLSFHSIFKCLYLYVCGSYTHTYTHPSTHVINWSLFMHWSRTKGEFWLLLFPWVSSIQRCSRRLFERHYLVTWAPVGPPKMDGSWWRGLTECGPLEKGMANHFSILALRIPWTIWKGKMIGYQKRNSPGH